MKPKFKSITPIDVGEPTTDRRNFLKGTAAGLATGLFTSVSLAHAESKATQPNLRLDGGVFNEGHELQDLAFNPSKLKGISARLIESHWAKNYGGSVRALNETNRRLAAALADPDLPAFIYNDLKREHLMRTGSVVLHELYFDNLGGGGVPPADVGNLLGASFGDFNRWETEYRRIAAGLGGGSGWVILGYNRHLHVLENYWMADHMHAPAATEPLLVLDMYEHSYAMDYGAATARYIDAFFANINWDVVLERVEGIC